MLMYKRGCKQETCADSRSAEVALKESTWLWPMGRDVDLGTNAVVLARTNGYSHSIRAQVNISTQHS